MHMCCVSGEEHATRSVRRCLSSHIGEPREPRDIVNAEVGSVDCDQRLTKVAQCRLVALVHLRFDQQDASTLSVLELADRIDPQGTMTNAPRRLAGHCALCNQ